MKNTVAVLVTRTARHPLYKKTYIRSKKFLAEDSLGVKLGDIVELVKVRPISKNKHWKVTKVIGQSLEEVVSQQLQEKGEELISEVMPEEKESGQGTVESEKLEKIKEKPTKRTKKEQK